MTASVMNLLTCPYCPPGRGRLSADLAALRAVEDRVDCVDLLTEMHRVVLFDSDWLIGAPCSHLVDLVLILGWESFGLRGEGRPAGGVEVDWSHPVAVQAGWNRIVTLTHDGCQSRKCGRSSTDQSSWHLSSHLLGAFRGPPRDLAWFVNPHPDAEPPARPGEEVGWWWIDASGLFTENPEAFVVQSLATQDVMSQ